MVFNRFFGTKHPQCSQDAGQNSETDAQASEVEFGNFYHEKTQDSDFHDSTVIKQPNENSHEYVTDNKLELDFIMQKMGELLCKIDSLTKTVEVSNLTARHEFNLSDEILGRLDKLSSLDSLVESQKAIIKKQHDASLKFNDDVIYKTQKPLIMELIGIADQIRMILENKREDASYDLVEALKDLEDSVEASLSNNSVKRFRETDSNDSVFNRRRQTVIGKEVTTDSEREGRYKSVAPGYEWTMPYLVVNSEIKLNKILEENGSPQTFSFVIRPEEVVKQTYINDI